MAIEKVNDQLRGKNGRIVGSSVYFYDMNKNTIYGHIKLKNSDFDYCENLKDLAENCVKVIDTICSDLEKYQNIIWLVDDRSKKELEGFINELHAFVREVSKKLLGSLMH